MNEIINYSVLYSIQLQHVQAIVDLAVNSCAALRLISIITAEGIAPKSIIDSIKPIVGGRKIEISIVHAMPLDIWEKCLLRYEFTFNIEMID